MRQILVLGAGKSTPCLIQYLLDHAQEEDWFVTVGDLDAELARKRVNGHSRGSAIRFDVQDTALRRGQIGKADVVVSMLTPSFHSLVALDCVERGTHMVCASYRTKDMRALETDALRQDVLLLCEMGMDPGLDHMSAMALIRRIRDRDGQVVGFRSYGSGLPAPDLPTNPLRYVMTWNPRGVVTSGKYGAIYREDGLVKVIPYHEVFDHTWHVEVDGVGTLEAYPNRDSLSYAGLFGIGDPETMIRGTLRYPGWSETWGPLVRLGLTNDTVEIPHLAERSFREVVEMFLPPNVGGQTVQQRTARWLQISPTGKIMENLEWLGLFSEEPVGCRGNTAAALLTHLVNRQLALPPEGRDVAILQHLVDVELPGGARERITSTLVCRGRDHEHTGMARTVGLPAGIGVKLLLSGQLPLTGCHIPTHPSVYEPVLKELEALDIVFHEQVQSVEASES